MIPVLCLTLDWGGRIFRLATRPVEVYSTRDGRRYHYRAGLPSTDLETSIDMDEAAQTFQADALLPVDVASRIEAGYPLHGCDAEVALYSGTWDDREVVLRGVVTDPEYQPGVGLVRLTVTSDPGEDTASWPPADAVVDSDTWPSAVSEAEGRSYPWIIGSPGVYLRAGVTTTIGGAPCYVIYDATPLYLDVLISGHRADIDGGSGVIRIRDEETNIEDDLDLAVSAGAIWRDVDGLGRDVMTGRLSAAAGQAPAVFAGWSSGNLLSTIWKGGAGVRGRDESGITCAGDVIRWALSLSSLPMDWRRTESATHLLRAWRLSGYWDQPCAPQQWLRDNVLPLLPVTLRYSTDGVYPLVWRWWAGPEDAVAHLEVGRSCRYVSGPTVQGQDVISGSTIRYSSTTSDTTPRSYRRVRPDAVERATDSRSLEARRLYLVSQPPEAEETTDLTWDHTTGGLAARGAIRRAAPVSEVVVRVDPTRHIEEGDVVLLTWPAVTGITRRTCLVSRRKRMAAGTDLTLRLTRGGWYA